MQTPVVAIAAVLVVAAAAVVKGTLGFGFPLVTVPALAALIGAREAVIIVTVPAFVANLIVMASVRERRLPPWWPRLALPLVAGAVAGALLFGRLPPRTLDLLLGGVTLGVLAVVGRQGASAAGAARLRAWAPAAGLLAGVLGGSTDVPGPPLVIFVAGMEPDRDRFLVGLTALLLLSGATQMATFAQAGLYDPGRLAAAGLACLPMAAGAWLGVRLRGRLQSGSFRWAVLGVVGLAALNLLRQGLLG